MENIKVSNEWGVPNQFVIEEGKNIYFQSHDSIIAKKTPKGIFLDVNDWDYSTTTGKYRNKFLNENISDTRKKIKSGEYKLINLNE